MGTAATNIKGTNEDGNTNTAFVASDGVLGLGDGDYATSGTLSDGPYSIVYGHKVSVLNVTSTGVSGTLTSVTVPAASYWRCPKATSITVTSGEITAYKGRGSS